MRIYIFVLFLLSVCIYSYLPDIANMTLVVVTQNRWILFALYRYTSIVTDTRFASITTRRVDNLTLMILIMHWLRIWEMQIWTLWYWYHNALLVNMRDEMLFSTDTNAQKYRTVVHVHCMFFWFVNLFILFYTDRMQNLRHGVLTYLSLDTLSNNLFFLG